jgi:pimeloyl-ACP methyl ester carboxylesterase
MKGPRRRHFRRSLLLLLLLLPSAAQGQEVRTEQGELDGAPYRIQVPASWNRGLVVYTHGYLTRGTAWRPMTATLSGIFLERGFAVAESGYSRQGWAVEEGVLETEALRRHFVERFGRPDSTFVVGGSMGGLITLATIESYPEAYDGALPMCAVLAPALVFFQERVFGLLVTFEALFGEALPADRRPVIESAELSTETVTTALAVDPGRADRFARRWGIRPEDLPGTVAFFHLCYRELRERAGGNPIDNRGTVYAGFDDDRVLNENAPRFAAEPGALAYLLGHYTPTGAVRDPVLAIHTTYDPGVPPDLEDYYRATVALAGQGDRFVQYRIEADGHCNFRPDLIAAAFDRLRGWAATGIRPPPGVLR